MSSKWSPAQDIVLAFAPIPSGVLSFFASGAISIMIYRSPNKFDKPFKRIILGMSIYDLFQSFSAVASSFASPSGSRWGAIGNQGTCTTQAILSQMGTLGSPLYSLILAVYYLCTINLSMTDHNFRQKIERILHVLFNGFVVFSTIFLGVTGHFNKSVTNCWIAPYPADCIHDPDIECIRGEKAYAYRWIFAGFPLLASFFGNIVIMTILIRKFYTVSRVLNQLKSWSRPIEEETRTQGVFRRLSTHMASFRSSAHSSVSLQSVEGREEHDVLNRVDRSLRSFRPSSRSITQRTNECSMQRELVTQALLYSAAFVVIYLCSFIFRIIDQKTGSPPFFLALLVRILNPLQGFLNILIYTRIPVSRLRRNSENSWLQSFVIIVKSGVEYNQRSTNSRRSTVTRRSFTTDRRFSTMFGGNSLVDESKRKSFLEANRLGRSSLVDGGNFEHHKQISDPDSPLKQGKEVTFQNQNDFTENNKSVDNDAEVGLEEVVLLDTGIEDFIAAGKENNINDSIPLAEQREENSLHAKSEEETGNFAEDESVEEQ